MEFFDLPLLAVLHVKRSRMKCVNRHCESGNLKVVKNYKAGIVLF